MLRHRSAATRHRRDDRGFTLVELLVTVLITSILAAITGGFVVMLSRQNTSVKNTIAATEADQIAESALLPFLHTGLQVTTAMPQKLVMVVYAGYNWSTQAPQCSVLTAQLLPGSAPNTASGKFTVSVSALSTCGASPVVGTAHTVGAFYAQYSAGAKAFDYLGANVDYGNSPCATALNQITSISVNVTFLSGSAQASADNVPIQFQTTIYLQSAASTTTSTSTTTTTLASCAGTPYTPNG
jgi:prepilin-type N-terminal cleavage/methylation domain-containing protein